MERRQRTRYRVWFPVTISYNEQGTLAVTHNVGTGGMLLALPTAPELGQHVRVTFDVLPANAGTEAGARTLEGRVIRVEANPEDPEGAFPRRIALEFDAVDEALDPLLAEAEKRMEHLL